ncbi:hypothetical protein MLD38_039095 [Melastoma candidum]|uniref:Uncharacterized protein n=1 Tax=Melastoma candidum TaxID=119954 RepID=A0ACB9L2H8_9MYRT|nr:hypothetical protein MLD38_039095 [Melastoma candidum]
MIQLVCGILLLLGFVHGNHHHPLLDFYVVYLGDDHPRGGDATGMHLRLLSSLKGSVREAKESLVYSYTRSFNAFAAKLSRDEARRLLEEEDVVAVVPNSYKKLHTTRSWDFLGFPQSARRNHKTETDTIVGLFDTGITPDSESFSDKGFGCRPLKWQGKCGPYTNFSGCNNKLIGATYFKLDRAPDPNDVLSPVDMIGHGTHTSSTLAGNVIPGANVLGFAEGTARGAVPSARIAMYKVCWASSGCSDMDILAAFDAAIHDGVDIISISIGGDIPDYTHDSVSIGSFHAMKKGILVLTSAGNDGPNLASVANHAPWLFTVAASGIDRHFMSMVRLGNGQNITGIGINAFELNKRSYALVSGADTGRSSSRESARFCMENSLDVIRVNKKIVYCKLQVWGVDSVVKRAGGIGTIIQSPQFLDAPQIYMAPATMVSVSAGDAIDEYIHSTRSPSAVIDRTEQVRIRAPFVASFSSRGPNPGSLHLLKPDIVAPGIDILAAYTPMKSLTGLKGDTRFSKFTLMSGTSMACPHVAGVAAYVKSFHPTWSPAAIRSAIMTTAKPMSSRINVEAELAYGVGQIDPTRAVSPGLVYDVGEMSYIQFLCHEGYKGSSLAVLVQGVVNCSSLLPGLGYDALNYPTMQVTSTSNQDVNMATFFRTVTYVGLIPAVFNATIRAPKGISITVRPTSLSFMRTLQKRSFKVVVRMTNVTKQTPVLSAALVWRSNRYFVRSPIVINNVKFEASPTG